MDRSTDPVLKSFIRTAADSHFPIQNLPYGVFRPRPGDAPRVGMAIGGHVLDLSVLETQRLLDLPPNEEHVFDQSSLNRFMALPSQAWRDVRKSASHLLQADVTTLRDDPGLRERALLPMDDVEMLLPVEIGDFTDFYCSREHATNVGTMIRGPENALNANWLHMPVAYHGRASSVVVSGSQIRRPAGQRRSPDSEAPVFGPSRAVDFELEVGYFIGRPNQLGHPIAISDAWDHVFGLVLVNDWSARDIQKWEYQPLGPFLSKNFATFVSPWVVPLVALQPFRTTGPEQHPRPLAYLHIENNTTFDIHLEATLTAQSCSEPERICATNLRHVYWNIAQQVAHHTVNGCNLRTGDLLATGTVSGPTPDSLGCLLELTRGGQQPITLASGESRQFSEDYDRMTITGWCQGSGYRLGFGEVTGQLLPAHS